MKEQVSDMIRKGWNATRFLIDSERRTVYGETEGVVRESALSARAGKRILEGPVNLRVRTYARVPVQCDAGGRPCLGGTRRPVLVLPLATSASIGVNTDIDEAP